MPFFVLEYDSYGNVVGGHMVEEEQDPLLATSNNGLLPNPLYEPPPHVPKPPKQHHSSPNPLFLPSYPKPHFGPIHQVPERIPSPIQTKSGAFLDSFIKHFVNDAQTMATFEALFTNYNMRVIEETDFYVGIFMLLSRTKSWGLLPALVEVLPVSWQAQDLTWLHQAAEVLYQDRVTSKSSSLNLVESIPSSTFETDVPDPEERISPDTGEDASSDTDERPVTLADEILPATKRKKRSPANGFRTSYASATADSPPMFVDPTVLSIHNLAVEKMYDSDETTIQDEHIVTKGVVKLKFKSSRKKPAGEATGPRRISKKTPPMGTKAKRSSLRQMTDADENFDEHVSSDKPVEITKSHTYHDPASETLLSRKGRSRYGDLLAADVKHFGHFPTRRAVIARASRPYVHLSCGKGFGHPMDVKHHHFTRERGKSGTGCPGKDGVPQGEDDKWDAHPSARVEYPDLNYTKVKDGYVLLDQESRDKLDNAIAAGLEYLADRKKGGSASLVDGDHQMEMEDETEVETTEMTADTEMEADQSSVRAATLGLRKRSTKAAFYGA